jgi:hypothetical protein
MATSPSFQVLGVLGIDDTQATNALGNFMGSLGKLTAAVEKAVNEIETKFEKAAKAIKPATKAATGFQSSLRGVHGALTALVSGQLLGQIKSLTDSFMRAAKEVEGFRSTLQGLTGTAEEADDILAQIKEKAEKSPFSFPEVAEATIKIKQMGESFKSAGKEEEALNVSMLLSAKYGKSLQATTQLVTMAYEGNVGAGRRLERMYGFTGAQAAKYGADIDKNGKAIVGSTMATDDFTDALKRYADTGVSVAEAKSHTFVATMKHLEDSFVEAKNAIAVQMQPYMIKAAELMKSFADAVTHADPALLKMIGVIGGVAAAAATLLAALAPVVYTISAIAGSSGVGLLVSALGGLSAGAVVGPIAAIATAFTLVYEAVSLLSALFGTTMPTMGELAKGAFDTIKGLVNDAVEGFKLMGSGIAFLVEKLKELQGLVPGSHPTKPVGFFGLPEVKAPESKDTQPFTPSVSRDAVQQSQAVMDARKDYNKAFGRVSFSGLIDKDNNPNFDKINNPNKPQNKKAYDDYISTQKHLTDTEKKVESVQVKLEKQESLGKSLREAEIVNSYDAAKKSQNEKDGKEEIDVEKKRRAKYKLYQASGPSLDHHDRIGVGIAQGQTVLSPEDGKVQIKDLEKKVSLGQITAKQEQEGLLMLQARIAAGKEEPKQVELLAQGKDKLWKLNQKVTDESIKQLSNTEAELRAQGKLTPLMELSFIKKKGNLLKDAGTDKDGKWVDLKLKAEFDKQIQAYMAQNKKIKDLHEKDAITIAGIDQGTTATKLLELDKQADDMRAAGHNEVDIVKIISDKKKQIWADERIAHINAVAGVEKEIEDLKTKQRTGKKTAIDFLRNRGYTREANVDAGKLSAEEYEAKVKEVKRNAAAEREKAEITLDRAHSSGKADSTHTGTAADAAADGAFKAGRNALTDGVGVDASVITSKAKLALISQETKAELDNLKVQQDVAQFENKRAAEKIERDTDLKKKENQTTALTNYRAAETSRMTAAGTSPEIAASRLTSILQDQLKLQSDILDIKAQEALMDKTGQDRANALSDIINQRVANNQKAVQDQMALYDQMKAAEKKEDDARWNGTGGPKVYGSAQEAFDAQAKESADSSTAFRARSDADDRTKKQHGLEASLGVSSFDLSNISTAERSAVLGDLEKASKQLGGKKITQEDYSKLIQKARDKAEGGVKVTGGHSQKGGVDIPLSRAAAAGPVK